MFRLSFFPLFLILVLYIGCTKADQVVAPAIPPRADETPLAKYWKDSSGYLSLKTYDPQAKELGFAFQARKNGVIWAMGIRMPQAGEVYTVTIWDSSARKVIKQKSIQNNSSAAFSYLDLSSAGYNEAFPIEKNKTYLVAVNTAAVTAAGPNRGFYLLSKANSGNFLPLFMGNIVILNGVYSSLPAPTPVFPDKTNKDVFGLDLLFGLVDIGFYPTEY